MVYLWMLVACGDLGLQTVGAAPEEIGGMLQLSPDGAISFGDVSPEAPHVSHTEVSVASVGDEAMGVMDAWVEGDEEFWIEQPPFPKLMEPGMEIPFDVRFQPSAIGSFRASLLLELGSGELMERTITGNGCTDDDADGECGG